MKKVIFLFVTTLAVVSFISCGNKSTKGAAVVDSDSVATDTASIDSVSDSTTQQIAKDSAAVNEASAAESLKK